MHTVQIRLFPFVPILMLAVSPGAVAAGVAASEDILEEVVVTGTLRAQKLGEVPGSVTVLGEATLQDAGQQHFEDVLGLVPNLNWAAGTSRPRYFQIRGIGEREQYEGAPNPSVGFLIDDIDFSGLGMPATLFDIRQIEVLRGPQGTQYGANALAGLIVVRSNDPQAAAGYSLEATGGDYGTRSLGLTATGPVAALNSAWRLALQKYESDGFMRNAWLGRDDTNDRDEFTARLKWHASIGESALDLTFLHANIDNGYDGWALDNTRVTQSDEPGMDRQKANAASLRLTREAIGGANTLTAIASYARSRTHYGYDYDWGNADFWQPYAYSGAERWDRLRRTGSAELRLASPAANAVGDMAWLLGAYALRLEEEGRYASAGDYVDPLDADFSWSDARLIDDNYHATSLALFGQLDGRFGQRWRWSAGMRMEQRRAQYRDTGEVNAEPRLSDLGARDRMLGGQLSLSTELSEVVTGYGLLSRGYKAGGFNLGEVLPEERDFAPEYLWNAELGLKARLPESRGSAELALFYQRRRDQQVRSGRQLEDTGAYDYITINVPRGYGAGLEASLQYALTSQLQVGASLGLLHARSGAFTMEDEDGNPVRVASRESAHAPSFNAALNATWRHPEGIFARVDVTAMDDFYFDVPTDHDQQSSAYALTHLKLGYERGNWNLYGWMRNVFDKRYAVRGFYFGNDPRAGWEERLYQQYGDPRQFGLSVDLHF